MSLKRLGFLEKLNKQWDEKISLACGGQVQGIAKNSKSEADLYCQEKVICLIKFIFSRETVLYIANPAQDHKDDEVTEAFLTWRVAERGGTSETGEEKAQEDLINVYKSLVEGDEEEEDRLFSVVLTDRTRCDGQNQKTGNSVWTHGNTLLLWWLSSAGTGCSEWLSILHPLKYSKPSWMWLWETCSRWLCLNRRLDLMISRGPLQPQHFDNSVIFHREALCRKR